MVQVIIAGKLVDPQVLEQRAKTIHKRNRAHFMTQLDSSKRQLENQDECSRLLKRFKKAASELKCDIKDCDDESLKKGLIEVRNDFNRFEKKIRALKRNLIN